MHIENLKQINELFKNGKLDDLVKSTGGFEQELKAFKKTIEEKQKALAESKKQLEIAMSMDPHNNKYSDSYTKLKLKIEYNDRQFHSGNGYNNGYAGQPQQMGGTDNSCLTFCATWCCMDMLCSMCCR